MTLQQLRYIVAIDRHRNFARAAEACQISQPTLSAMLQKLEEELDVRLFDRTNKQVVPTAAGEKIVRQAERALMEADIEDRDFEYSPAFPDYITQNEQRLIWLMGKIREYSDECEQIKEQVRVQMEAHGDKSFDTGGILITMVAPSVRETFDSKRFKTEHEDMYGQYVKQSTTKPTLKLTLR